MQGISSYGKENIAKAVEDIFDRIALEFIGQIPKLRHKKHLLISSVPNYNLANLFVQAMANHSPNIIEQDTLKSLLESAHGYIESLKAKTKANITEQIDGLVKEAKIKNQKVTEEQVRSILEEEFRKAKAHLKTIAESESTKIRNIGSSMTIARVASGLGEEDPTVFFVVTKDNVTCKECIRLHLMPDGVTPRVWKFSELKHSYHKRGEDSPSFFGLHPHCRCSLTYLVKGFGFKNGKVTYLKGDHDEYRKQRS